MKKHSAGLVVYRKNNGRIEVLVGHMGAPWWAKKDIGAWSVPKGEIEEGEDPQAAAKREFEEELGLPAPAGDFLELGTIEQYNNKTVIAWAVETDMEVRHIKGNTFKAEWPPRSGNMQEFPEIDRAQWMTPEIAAKKTVRGQDELFKRLADKLGQKFETGKAETESSQQTLL